MTTGDITRPAGADGAYTSAALGAMTFVEQADGTQALQVAGGPAPTIGTVAQGNAGAQSWLAVLTAGTATIGNVGCAATSVTPTAQATTASYADVTGSTLDTLNRRTVAYTIVETGGAQSIKWKVLGGNASDFSDAQVVQAERTVLASAVDSYSAEVALWRYYRVQIVDGSGHGQATVRGICKG